MFLNLKQLRIEESGKMILDYPGYLRLIVLPEGIEGQLVGGIRCERKEQSRFRDDVPASPFSFSAVTEQDVIIPEIRISNFFLDLTGDHPVRFEANILPEIQPDFLRRLGLDRWPLSSS